jgi:hypothetical protein
MIWKKTPCKWGWRFTGGGLPDGRNFKGAGDWIFSDDGTTLRITGDISVGDEKLDSFDDAYRRVNN